MKCSQIFTVVVLGGSFALAQQSDQPQVLFSAPPPAQASAQPSTAQASPITDAERIAVTITAWDLDVHLVPHDQSMEAHARVTLRNDSNAPLRVIPLQLSSSLHFETIGLQWKRLTFSAAPIVSDADHTGALVEAAVALPEALAPYASLTLDVDYGGAVPLTAQRLIAIGAPEAQAQASDWDRISAEFTGLRGFGDVVWYPVSSVPVVLGDGARLFTEIGRQKLLDQDATIALRITDEFVGEAPNVAILDGHFVTLDTPTSMPTASFPGVIAASIPATRIGFEVPSLFLTRRIAITDNGLRVLATDADSANAKGYLAAASMTAPLMKTWFGTKSHALATILELPEPDDAPAETGDLLAMPLADDPAQKLAPTIAHALSHAAFFSSRAWLNEGVASFLGTLWVESSSGRTAAMESLNGGRDALALVEPGTPGQGPGEDLLHAVSPVYYRTKANYVLWMLRDIVGDQPLQAALQAYDPSKDTQPDYFEHLVEQTSSKDLDWFFSNWVNQDRGLPDLSIGGIYPSPEAHLQILVAVDIVNDGYVEAAVPVTVKGSDAQLITWVRVPAHGHITQRVLFQETPSEVDVNDGTVPEVKDTLHRRTLTSASTQ